jgi:hypothetical protein
MKADHQLSVTMVSLDGTKGRAGRWAAIIKAGATIRAADLDAFEPYRLPLPMEQKVATHDGFTVIDDRP